MKTEPCQTMQEVWAIKEALSRETQHLTGAAEYFQYIRQNLTALRLPVVHARRSTVHTVGEPHGDDS